MTLKLKTSKPTEKKNGQSRYVPPFCRRCGPECQCTDEEIDSGGPA